MTLTIITRSGQRITYIGGLDILDSLDEVPRYLKWGRG